MASDGKIAHSTQPSRRHSRTWSTSRTATRTPSCWCAASRSRPAPGGTSNSPTPVDELRWADLASGGYTDLSAGLDLLRSVLTVPPMQSRALPPAIVLISDGMPTDDYIESLQRLEAEPWGARSVRIAVGIGRGCRPRDALRFMGDADAEPVRANNPEDLVAAIRWASTHVSRVASSLAPAAAEPVFSRAPHARRPRCLGGGVVNRADPVRWRAQGATHRGSSHERSGAPNQDAYAVRHLDDALVAAVADGHGGRRYVRSGTGARIAVDLAMTIGAELLEVRHPDPVIAGRDLPTRLVPAWRSAVLAHLAANALQDDEIERCGETRPCT